MLALVALVVAFFSVGGWYMWHGTTATIAAPPPPAASLTGLQAAAAKAARHAPRGATRIMVVGNSVAHFLASAMKQTRATPPVAVLDATVLGCEFPPQVVTVARAPGGAGLAQSTPCGPASEVGALATFRPAVAVWIPADLYGVGGLYSGKKVSPCSPQYDSLYSSALRREVARLGVRGTKVVLTTQAYPRTDYLVNNDHAIDCDNAAVRQVATATHSQLIDLFAYVCPNGRCRTTQQGVVLRVDGMHYEGAGGSIVAAWILGQIHV